MSQQPRIEDLTRIEDYALIGDLHTAALVSKTGSIDWLCLPRFDSGACFAALLGDEQCGHWQLAPTGEVTGTRRSYRGETLVLDTEMSTATGTVRITDLMPLRDKSVDLVRLVECLDGEVEMELRWSVRYGYGPIIPWVRHHRGDDERPEAVAWPDAVVLRGTVLPKPVDGEAVHSAVFTVPPGNPLSWSMQWYLSIDATPHPIDVVARVARTLDFWNEWSAKGSYVGAYSDAVQRSLLTLKDL